MNERQIVWLGPGATSYAAICESCLAAPDDPGDALGYRTAKVEGSLRAEADVGFTRCRRGHRLCIRRLARVPVSVRG